MYRILSKRFSSIKTVGVAGSGQMGTGIGYVFSRVANNKVIMFDGNNSQLEKSRKFINTLLDKEVAKNTLQAEDKDKILGNFTFTSKLDVFDKSDFVVEAIIENQDVKEQLFKRLNEVTRDDVILASNTSSISITKIASFTTRPDRVIGMHFMNPVPVMKLVEIIPGLQTSQETIETTTALVKSLNKEHTTSRDIPGFIANRILMPYINEAFFALHEGIGTPEDIDKTMKLGTNVPMGPLVLADFIGLDTCLFIMNVLHRELGDSKYRPCPLLVNYVNAGWVGKKSGRGVYDYSAKK